MQKRRRKVMTGEEKNDRLRVERVKGRGKTMQPKRIKWMRRSTDNQMERGKGQ